MNILKKLQQNTTSDFTSILSESTLFTERDMIQTPVFMLNVALSGMLGGGFTPGLTMLAGPSRHFKTGFALTLASAYLKKYKDAAILFYDSEFGSPQSYFDNFDIDTSRVVHTPITDVEQMKHDIMTQLNALDRDDRVIIVIDSIGNLASKKEVEDALEGKSVADMTRAKAMKSLFRMVTPHLMLKNIPLVAINHTYQEIGLFPKEIVGGGRGPMLAADTVFIIGRQQEKDGQQVVGYNFVINVEKSRFVKEKSKIIISTTFDEGISRWSGLIAAATESGHIVEAKKGRGKAYQRVDTESGELLEGVFTEDETNSDEFWLPVFKMKSFGNWIKNRYQLTNPGSSDTIEE